MSSKGFGARPRLPVDLLLVAVALVPIVGLGWLAGRQITELAIAEADLITVEEATADLPHHADAARERVDMSL